MLWLDSGEELSGGRTQPLGISEEFAGSPGTHDLTPGTGVLVGDLIVGSDASRTITSYTPVDDC